MQKREFAVLVLAGRLYFLAIIPFVGAVAAPWVFGPMGSREVPVFLLWSFVVLIYSAAAFLGYLAAKVSRPIHAHLLASVLVSGGGVACMLIAQRQLFAAVAIITFLQWVNFIWLRRTGPKYGIPAEWVTQHSRFVWTALACHMLVLLNLIWAAQRAQV